MVVCIRWNTPQTRHSHHRRLTAKTLKDLPTTGYRQRPGRLCSTPDSRLSKTWRMESMSLTWRRFNLFVSTAQKNWPWRNYNITAAARWNPGSSVLPLDLPRIPCRLPHSLCCRGRDGTAELPWGDWSQGRNGPFSAIHQRLAITKLGALMSMLSKFLAKAFLSARKYSYFKWASLRSMFSSHSRNMKRVELRRLWNTRICLHHGFCRRILIFPPTSYMQVQSTCTLWPSACGPKQCQWPQPIWMWAKHWANGRPRALHTGRYTACSCAESVRQS